MAEMSAVRELSGGTNIIYKVLWLMEEGRGRKVAATVSSDDSSILPPHTQLGALHQRAGEGRGRLGVTNGCSRVSQFGRRKAGFCRKENGAWVSEQFPG